MAKILQHKIKMGRTEANNGGDEYSDDVYRILRSEHQYSINMSHKKAELLKDTPKPPAGNGASAADYQKKIDEAQANGDLTAVAYYTRLAAQAAQA